MRVTQPIEKVAIVRDRRSSVPRIAAEPVVRARRRRRGRGGWSARRAAAGRSGTCSARARLSRMRQPPENSGDAALEVGVLEPSPAKQARCAGRRRRNHRAPRSASCSSPSVRHRPRVRRRRVPASIARSSSSPSSTKSSALRSSAEVSCATVAMRQCVGTEHGAALADELSAEQGTGTGLAAAVRADQSGAPARMQLQRRRPRSSQSSAAREREVAQLQHKGVQGSAGRAFYWRSGATHAHEPGLRHNPRALTPDAGVPSPEFAPDACDAAP